MKTELGESCLSKDSWLLKRSNTGGIITIGVYLLVHSSVDIGYDFYEDIRAYWKFSERYVTFEARTKTPRGKKKYIHSFSHLWLSQFMFICVISSVTVRLLRYQYEFGVSLTFNFLMYVTITEATSNSVVHFLQLVSHVGEFATMIQRGGYSTLKWFCTF